MTLLLGLSSYVDRANDWIGKFVDITNGIPSAHTIERIFSLISPTAMEEILIELMKLLKETKQRLASKSRGSLGVDLKSTVIL